VVEFRALLAEARVLPLEALVLLTERRNRSRELVDAGGARHGCRVCTGASGKIYLFDQKLSVLPTEARPGCSTGSGQITLCGVRIKGGR